MMEDNVTNGHVDNGVVYVEDISLDDVFSDNERWSDHIASVIREKSSTTEELDTVPGDSTGTTTDTCNPLRLYGNGCLGDEGSHVTYTSLQEEGVTITTPRLGPHSYENWSIILNMNREMDEGSGKKKRNLTKVKGMRGGMRQRPPQPLPRQSVKLKSVGRPPAPTPRKRRAIIGKPRPLQGTVTSEGDMAQADEMGDEGEGHSDDGFVDGTEFGSARRRTKKRQGVGPSLTNATSPPSSPSNTPLKRRTTNSRKNRIKPRPKKLSKPIQASADISTQETTTPGPASSETDESQQLLEESETATEQTPIHRLILKEEDEEMSRIMKTPPVTSTTPTTRSYKSAAIGTTKSVNARKSTTRTTKEQESNNESQTSDTELTSASAISLSSTGNYGKICRRVADSDFSTAPVSSETSDMSGSERKGLQVGSPSTSIPRPVNSPLAQRRTLSSPTTTTTGTIKTTSRPSNAKVGNFVSKRSSVAAMISQFDTKTPPTKAPPIKTPPSPVSSKTHAQVKQTTSSSAPKPELKPKPSPSPRSTTSPSSIFNEKTPAVSENKPKATRTHVRTASSTSQVTSTKTDTSGESSSSSPSLAATSAATSTTNKTVKRSQTPDRLTKLPLKKATSSIVNKSVPAKVVSTRTSQAKMAPVKSSQTKSVKNTAETSHSVAKKMTDKDKGSKASRDTDDEVANGNEIDGGSKASPTMSNVTQSKPKTKHISTTTKTSTSPVSNTTDDGTTYKLVNRTVHNDNNPTTTKTKSSTTNTATASTTIPSSTASTVTPISPTPTNVPSSTVTTTIATATTTTATTGTKRTTLPRRPPPDPPKSSSPQPQSDKRAESPRNYEEFIPTIIRSNSLSTSSTCSPRLERNIKLSSQDDDTDSPPPLPPRNYHSDESAVTSSIDKCPSTPIMGVYNSQTPPPLPSQPIPKRKSVLGHVASSPSFSPLLKRKEILPVLVVPTSPRSDPSNVYEEITVVPPVRLSSSPLPPPRVKTNDNAIVSQHYEMLDNFTANQSRRLPSYAQSDGEDSVDSDQKRFSASICVSNTVGLSPVSIRRAYSDKFKNNRLPVRVTEEDQSILRTPSMDILDERMNPVATSNSLPDAGYSSGDEGSISPNIGLPQPPSSSFTLPAQKTSSFKIDPEEEPLYQYINHIDFTSTPTLSDSEKTRTAPGKILTNQLEIARQLSINHRKLWSEQPEVIQSGILGTMSDQDRKLQEAMFEVLTSEASYLRSLKVLVEHFMDDPGMNPNLPEGRRVLDKRQHHVIFSNVKEVQLISTQFLKDLQVRQRESAIIQNICDIVLKYAENEFSCYIPYCTNQVYQMRELTQLLETNVMFKGYLKRLETHKRCQNLSMTSFLLLPMQRITRLPLLILAVLNRTSSDNPFHSLVEKTLRTVQKLVTACNDGARQMERTEELHLIHRQLEFTKMKPFPLVSVCRQLERKGPLVLLQVDQRLFGKPRIKKTSVFVFAFTDYILITKKKTNPKGGVSYRVIDYASKAVVEVVEHLKVHSNVSFPKHMFGEQETIAKATWAVSISEEKFAFLLMFLDNAFQKSEKHILVCQNDTDRLRWLEALTHPARTNQREDEKIYESWDCPQVQSIYDYNPQQPDELGLIRGDIVKVFRKMADGWYEGERLRDLQMGWFPSNFTVEIENAHTRARNLKERHRLLSTPINPDQY